MYNPDMLTDTRIFLLAAVVLLLVSIAGVAQRPVTAEMARYPVKASVTDDITNISIGISVDTNRIDFGELPARTMSAEKTLTVTNNEDRVLDIRVQKEGNISQFISLSPSSFSLPPESDQAFRIKIKTTNSTAPGTYSGTVIVEEQIPLWRLVWQRN